jgi:hypothetical protein
MFSDTYEKKTYALPKIFGGIKFDLGPMLAEKGNLAHFNREHTANFLPGGLTEALGGPRQSTTKTKVLSRCQSLY